MWAFLFGGRLSRLQYAVIAIPLLLLQYLTPAISMYAPMFFAKVFGADLVSFPRYLIVLAVVLDILVLVLMVISARRLRDIGLTGWLAIPILLKLVLGTVIGFVKVQAVTDGAAIDPGTHQLLTLILHGLYYYGLALALFLLVVPGRRRQTTATEPALAL